MGDKHDGKGNKAQGKRTGRPNESDASQESKSTSDGSPQAPGLTDLFSLAGAVGGPTLSPEAARKLPEKIRQQEGLIESLNRDAEKMTLLLKKTEEEIAARDAESVVKEQELLERLAAADATASAAIAAQEAMRESIRASEREMAQLNARINLH